MRRLFCYLFGHRSAGDRFDGSEYLKLEQWESAPDGIGRVHVTVYGDCPRCERRHRVGQFHRPGGPFTFDHVAGRNIPTRYMTRADVQQVPWPEIYDKPKTIEAEWRAGLAARNPRLERDTFTKSWEGFTP